MERMNKPEAVRTYVFNWTVFLDTCRERSVKKEIVTIAELGKLVVPEFSAGFVRLRSSALHPEVVRLQTGRGSSEFTTESLGSFLTIQILGPLPMPK